jgi:hypothetical protein
MSMGKGVYTCAFLASAAYEWSDLGIKMNRCFLFLLLERT